MADILQDVRALNNNGAQHSWFSSYVRSQYNPEWQEARFLGRGTVTVSQIFHSSPSRCAVADGCKIVTLTVE